MSRHHFPGKLAAFLWCIAIPCLAQPGADGKVQPSPPETAAEHMFHTLSRAQTVYVVYLGAGDDGTPKDYATFYRQLLEWGRYRVVPSTDDADLVMEFAGDRVYLYEGSTLLLFGTAGGGSAPDYFAAWRAAAGDVDTRTQASHRVSSPATPPKKVAGTGLQAIFRSPKRLKELLNAKSAFISADYFPSDYVVDANDLTLRLSRALTSWGRFSAATSVQSAGVVFQVTPYGGPPAGERTARPGDYEMVVTISILDPKTLGVWGWASTKYPNPASSRRKGVAQLADEIMLQLKKQVERASK